MSYRKVICAAVLIALVIPVLATPVMLMGSNAYDNEIDDYIMHLKYDPVGDIAFDGEKCEQLPVDFSEGDGKTVTVKYEIEKATNDGTNVLSNSSHIESKTYPGALIKGNHELSNNNPERVVVPDRNDLTMNINLPGIRKSTFTANPQNFGDVRDAITGKCEEWKRTGTVLAAGITYEYVKAESEKQLEVKLNLSAEHLANLNINVDWTSTGTETTYVVKYMQVYYTVSITPENLPSKYFGPQTTLDDIKRYISDNNQAVIVDSVVYGRMILASFTCTESGDDIDYALQTAICGTEEDISGDVKEVLKNTTISTYLYGGPATTAPTTYRDLKSFLDSVGPVDRSSINTAVPISYSTIFIDTSNTAVCNSTAWYNKKTIVETQEIEYSYDFDGGFVAHIWVNYKTYDRIDENGNYVNLRDACVERGSIACGENWSTMITAKHLEEMTIRCHADGGDDVVNNYSVYPLYKLELDYDGTICYQNLKVYVDDKKVLDLG